MKLQCLLVVFLVGLTAFGQQPEGKDKIRVAVLEFTTADIKGQERFLNHENKPIEIPRESTLTIQDHQSMDSIMQGYVRMIDAWDNSATNDANRLAQIQNNERDYAKTLALFNTVVNGPSRPMIIGADYLSAYLGKYNDVFAPVAGEMVSMAMVKLSKEPGFPRYFMSRLGAESGATHLIHGVVSDLRTKVNEFKGYGVETKTLNYQLDVILKVTDLNLGAVVYSNVYTGNHREQYTGAAVSMDKNIFHNLMTSALRQAAEDIYKHSKPGKENKIALTSVPVKVVFVIEAEDGTRPEDAEVSFNGVNMGKNDKIFEVPHGKYKIEVKAAGYKTSSQESELNGDQAIKIRLEK